MPKQTAEKRELIPPDHSFYSGERFGREPSKPSQICEQYTRNRNLEIKGIKQMDNEDVTQVLEKIGETLEEPIRGSDVDICHRVPTKDEGKTIIVLLQRRQNRDKVLQMARKKRLTTLLGLPTDFPVYINEYLYPAMKNTLGRAVARKREHDWKFCVDARWKRFRAPD